MLKRLISFILSLLLILSVFSFLGCNNNSSNQEKDPKPEEPIICETHTGKIKCSVCGINYFDELITLIKEHGTFGTDSYVYEGKVTTQGGNTYSPYVLYDEQANTFSLFCVYDIGFAEYDLLIEIPVSSSPRSTYTWQGTMAHCSAVGLIDFSTFSPATEELRETAYTGFNSKTMSSTRSVFCFLAQHNIEDALKLLLKKGTNNVTVKDLGFDNF